MYTALLITQIILAVTVVSCILLQSQGSGLGAAMGGGGETFHTRRGLEKVIYYITIVGVILFAANSIALLIFR
ncbi:MAG: preprotein translocase subunit SecG [Patescibacteria group bacterium]